MLTAVGIHPGPLLHHATIVQGRWVAQVGQIHSQERRVVPLVLAVQHRGHGRQGRVRLGGTVALDLRAGNEVTWAVARVRWRSEMARASEDWVHPGDQSVDLGREEGWRWTAVMSV